jgi:uncharacterized cupredoxin-like copper-binding protein
MTSRRWLPILLVGAAISVAGTATAQDNSHASHSGHMHAVPSFDAGEPGTSAKVSRRIDIVAREGDGRMFFEPARISVKRGESVDFVVRNEGELEHEFVLGSASENASHAAEMAAMPEMKHADPNAVRVAPGKSAHLLWTFSKAGDFEFACLIPGHYEAGMKGEAVVN